VSPTSGSPVRCAGVSFSQPAGSSGPVSL
jgi:hypothetical protein